MNWWVWERAATLHLMLSGSTQAGLPHKREWGVAWPTPYGVFRDNIMKYICDLDGLSKVGEQIINKYFLNKDNRKKKEKRWNELCKKLLELYEKHDKIDLRKLNDDELYDSYVEFHEFFDEWWGYCIVAEPISYAAEEMLKRKVKDMKKFNILVSPTKPSYLNEQEEKLFKIVKEMKKGKDVDKMLEKHSKEYFWMQNNYLESKYLDKEYFRKAAKEYMDKDVDKLLKDSKNNLKKTIKKKKKLIKELKLDEYTVKIIELIDEFCDFQDKRKMLDLRGHHYYDNLCKEAARRVKIPCELFRNTTPEILKQSLLGKDVRNEIQALNGNVFITIHENGYDILTGKEARKKEQEILVEIKTDEVEEIDGMCASGGRVSGKVRVMLKPGEVKEGEILVTTMTSPDFVVAMKKAAAIITDEGGITSHAAIVSRELGIPCVIGTKIATKVLKDGMEVEVKANHGIVKIIK